MRINIITYNNEYGLTQDINVLIYMLKRHFKDRVEIFAVNFFDYKCNYVDLNIFLETVSFTLLKYAPINILIPNQEWYYKTWTPYIKYFDKILVKSNYGENIFKYLLSKQDPTTDLNKRVINIGWQSKDKFQGKYTKDYTKYLHVCGKSKHKQTQLVVDNWLPEFPPLTVLYSPIDVEITEKEQDNIIYLRERVSDEELGKLLNESGVHICCSDTEGFGHYIQEAKSVKSIVVTLNAPPMNNFVDDTFGFLVKYRNKKPVKQALGSKYTLDGNDFQTVIKKIINTPISELKNMGEIARKSYLKTCQTFRDTIKDVFRDIFAEAVNIGKEYKQIKEKEDIEVKEMIKDENLPPISIITPTYNRPHMFLIALYNFINFEYPREKIQWVIVDDGDEDKRVSDMIPNEEHVDIKYIVLDKRVTIGKKRNICIENCDNDIIICMDDDDYYPKNSLKLRVLELLKSNKRCVTCTTIACFHINKLISMINVPPHKMPFEERISEATLCFYKDFWEERKFRESCHIGEAKDFLEDRVDECHEISWEGIIISLMHNRNISGKITMGDTPNGCHYGWDDKLYLFITNLDWEIKEEEEKHILKSRQGKVEFADDYKIIEYRHLKEIKSDDDDKYIKPTETTINTTINTTTETTNDETNQTNKTNIENKENIQETPISVQS